MSAAGRVTDVPGPVRRLVLSLADRLGCTEGQLQTAAIGVTLAILTAAIGLPPVFEERARGEVAAPAAIGPDADPAPVGPGEGPGVEPDAAVGGPVSVDPGALGLDQGPVDSGPHGQTPQPMDAPPGPQLTDPSPVGPATPPSRLEHAGQNGMCELESRVVDNPRRVEGAEPTPVWIYEPAGGGAATITGGICDDDQRPVVLLAHGFGQTDPVAYEALIEHLVSVGSVVIYPVYEVTDGSRTSLEESHRVVEHGFAAAVAATPRADRSRVGVWGHSHGGGMTPHLVQRMAARGWGTEAMWMMNVAQAFTQLVGAEDIAVPNHLRVITIAFQHDAMADARLGIDVFRSLLVPRSQKNHLTILSDLAAGIVAEHGAPSGTRDQADPMDHLLWRYTDLLQLCALHAEGCDADLSTAPGPDGDLARRAIVSDDPVDVGPYPAVLAECDAGFGPMLNPRIARCGPTRI